MTADERAWPFFVTRTCALGSCPKGRHVGATPARFAASGRDRRSSSRVGDAPFPSDLFDKVTVAAFVSARARDAAGSFIGRRIELFCGEIDKLW
jgi:hypothetical protein